MHRQAFAAAANPAQEHRLALVDEIHDLDVAVAREQDVRVKQIRLFCCSVQYGAETQLADVRATVERGPEQPLDVARSGQCCEQRPVSENRSGPGVHALDREARLEIEELELLDVDRELDVVVGLHPR